MLGLFGAREATAPQPESDCPSEMHGELFVGFKPGPIGIFRSGSARHWAMLTAHSADRDSAKWCRGLMVRDQENKRLGPMTALW